MTPQLIQNRFRGTDDFDLPDGIPFPSVDVAPVQALLAQCPAHASTPLVSLEDLARRVGFADLHAKDERGRMGLGSFKALGAAHVIARDAVETGLQELSTALQGRTYVTASAGNHGLSVAAGARIFGARAVVYLSETVPHSFAEKLTAKGAEVVRAGRDYEASMDAAADTAAAKGWTLLSDSSWPGYVDRPLVLMQGYLALMAEVAAQIPAPPTHVFVQAGVGGLAAAVAAATRSYWGDALRLVVVEPTAAPYIARALEAGHFVSAPGPVSSMGRLDCKEASLIALRGLARDADAVMTLTDAQVEAALPDLAGMGLATTPSGAASLVAAMRADAVALGLTAQSRVLCFVTEEPAA